MIMREYSRLFIFFCQLTYICKSNRNMTLMLFAGVYRLPVDVFALRSSDTRHLAEDIDST